MENERELFAAGESEENAAPLQENPSAEQGIEKEEAPDIAKETDESQALESGESDEQKPKQIVFWGPGANVQELSEEEKQRIEAERAEKAKKAKRYTAITTTVALIAAVALVLIVNPTGGGKGILPGCILYELTGIKCTTCGATRAVYCFFTFDFANALKYHALFTVTSPLMVYFYLGYFVNSVAGRRIIPMPKYKDWNLYALFGVLLVFMLVRNLPIMPDFLDY